ncbi:MAG: hypothetical protein QNJ84_02305 [Alphaproteobacteria bacterium]|nr:hypothetical protein [Alphaproteobacteria bacterium]
MAELGHNSAAGRPTQWQTPHLPHDHEGETTTDPREPDLDLVESAFVEAFGSATDPTSFLRLSKIPFVTERGGTKLELLRVQVESTADVASVTPWMGGGHRVAPLPAALVSRRGRLRFVYLASDQRLELSLADVRDLPDLTPPGGGWMD